MFLRSVSLTCLLVAVSPAQPAKRPLNHKDYDSWRTIAGQHLSADGKFLGLRHAFPQEGDGEVVIRNLVTGKDLSTSRQAPVRNPRPLPPKRDRRRKARGTTITFSADSKFVVFFDLPGEGR